MGPIGSVYTSLAYWASDADHEATIGAINRGEVYRYITKPWNEEAILLVVRDALERQSLQREKLRLEELTRQQNEQLRDLNATLEQRVRDRTAELSLAQKSLQASHDRLKMNFLTLIKVLSGLIETRGGAVAGHGRRVADMARRIALRMGLSAREAQDIFVAGLLHEIGKTAFPDTLIGVPESTPKTPTLVIVNVPPLICAGWVLPDRAVSTRPLSACASSSSDSDSAFSMLGTTSPRGVAAAMPRLT